MPTFEIECIDTSTFKVYVTSVTAVSLHEARQEAIRNGHKLSKAGQTLNPQLVPASSFGAPDTEDDGGSERRTIKIILALIVVAVLAFFAVAVVRLSR